jgi:hypothetical protein
MVCRSAVDGTIWLYGCVLAGFVRYLGRHSKCILKIILTTLLHGVGALISQGDCQNFGSLA